MKKILLTAMKSMKQKKTSEVSILLTDDEEIQSINKQYRNIDTPTDVLAFSQVEGLEDYSLLDEIDEYLLGDIIISTETAQRQASYFGHSLQHEMTVLLIHGLLHLLGFDHVDQEGLEKMQTEEKRIFRNINKNKEI